MIIFVATLSPQHPTRELFVNAREKSHIIINDEKCLLVYLLFILCERRNGEVLIVALLNV